MNGCDTDNRTGPHVVLGVAEGAWSIETSTSMLTTWLDVTCDDGEEASGKVRIIAASRDVLDVGMVGDAVGELTESEVSADVGGTVGGTIDASADVDETAEGTVDASAESVL